MKLLNRFSSYSPIYNNGLTNHLPMVVIALHQMGVSQNDIKEIVETYADTHELIDLHSQFYPKTPDDEKYITLTNTYINVIRDHGIKKTVSSFLQDHANKLPSALFHGLIRLYYSVLYNEDELLIAQSLAYFLLYSKEYIIDTKEADDIKKIEELITYRVKADITFTGKSTSKKIDTILEDDFIKSNLFTVKNISQKEDELIDLFTTQFLRTHDFYILHVITGFQALHGLKDYFDDYDYVLNQFFVHAQLILLLNDYKELYEISDDSNTFSSPDEIAVLRDAHDIKLLFSCYQLEKDFTNVNIQKIISYIKEKG